MISLLVLSAASNVEPRLTKAWHMDLPIKTKLSLESKQLRIAGKSIDIKTGFGRPPLHFDFDVQVGRFDGLITSDLIENNSIRKVFYRGPNYLLAVAGPVVPDSKEAYITKIEKLDFQGKMLEETGYSKLTQATQPMLYFPPYQFIGNVKDGFFTIFSNPFYGEHNTAYQTVVLLSPLRVSPIKLIQYLDLTEPKRAIGFYHENFNQWAATTNGTTLMGQVVACGDINTGKIFWKLSPDFKWAGRVGGRVLAYNYRSHVWYLINEASGAPTVFLSAYLKDVNPMTQTMLAMENHLISIKVAKDGLSKTITSFGLSEKGSD